MSCGCNKGMGSASKPKSKSKMATVDTRNCFYIVGYGEHRSMSRSLTTAKRMAVKRARAHGELVWVKQSCLQPGPGRRWKKGGVIAAEWRCTSGGCKPA